MSTSFIQRHSSLLVALVASALASAPWTAATFALSALVPLATSAAQGVGPDDHLNLSSFQELDRVEGELSFNPVPRRPMALSADPFHLFAVNTHNSTVLDFSAQPTKVFHVPKSPVSIGIWDDDSNPSAPEKKLVVVCDGTYALVILDRLSGNVLRLVELRDFNGTTMGEPGDLLIDQDENMAFVSCAAGDAVLQINLVDGEIVSKFDLPAKDPVFMCFDETPNKNVLVAPMFSGNNSGARQFADSVDVHNVQHQGPTVVDFVTQGISPDGILPPTRLPDRDLFRCVRATPPVEVGIVEPVTTGMGTVLFACGINPLTHKIWQLNTEANNKDSFKQTMGAVKGNFVQNRLSIVADPGAGNPPAAAPSAIKDLDSPTRSVGQPYGLSFAGGLGLVTGLLTDNLTVLNTNGAFLGECPLPDGSIPRASLFSPDGGLVFVYCWGTSKIEVHRLSDLAHLNTLDLGHDPTPNPVKEGRRIFYDAAHSLHNNASCASCHVEGRTDMVVWNLSKGTIDDKGPMVTQTLAGIEKYVPFHWRGEQQLGLIDFNPAFVELLGAPDPDDTGPLNGQLSPADFALFERFVLSIQNRPNPFENEQRMLDDAIEPPQLEADPLNARASVGQVVFMASCENCHHLPIGTSNDIVGDGVVGNEQNPRRQFFKVAPFHDLYKKEQDADKITDNVQLISMTLAGLNGGPNETSTYPLLGVGLAHTGLVANTNQFVGGFQGLSHQDFADVTSLIYQWDQGVAPATYRGWVLDASTATKISTYLIPQANARNCDIAVFGTSSIGGTPTPMRWYFDRGQSPPFVAELTSVPPQGFAAFPTDGSNVFIGLPVGAGRRFAIDFDGDEILNQDEILNGTDPNNPSSPPLPIDLPGPQFSATIVMATSRCARINIEANETCTATITYTRIGGGTPQTKSASEFARTHSVVLNDLLKSQDYDVIVTVNDRGGHPASQALTLSMRNGNGNPDVAVIGNLAWTTLNKSAAPGGLRTLQATATVRADEKNGFPPDPVTGVRVIGRIFVNDVLNSTFTSAGLSTRLESFKVLKTAPNMPDVAITYAGLSGPFLLSPETAGAGNVNLRFNLNGLFEGDKVTLNIELVVTEAPFPNPGQPPPPPAPPFVVEDISTWNMPSTPAAFRSISTIM